MDSKEKIDKMLSKKTISPEQAKLLLSALQESEERKRKVLQGSTLNKKKREKKLLGFVSTWGLIILFLLGFITYLGLYHQTGKDTSKALQIFEKASLDMKQSKYQDAIELYRRGIRKAPRLSLGYSLLAIAYRLEYQQTGNTTMKEKEFEAFEKAEKISQKSKKKNHMIGTSLFFVFLTLILIFGVAGSIILLSYNSLVTREEKVNEQWAVMQAQYQRKLALIPGLLEVIKDYTHHEKEIYHTLIRAKSDAQTIMNQTEDTHSLNKELMESHMQSQEKVTAELKNLYTLQEKYPDLRSNRNFTILQEEITETENMITKEKVSYNKQIRKYNSVIRFFPLNIISGFFGFLEKKYLSEHTKSIGG